MGLDEVVSYGRESVRHFGFASTWSSLKTPLRATQSRLD